MATTAVPVAQPVDTFWRDYAMEMAGSIAAGTVGAMIGDTPPFIGAIYGVVHKLVFDPINHCLETAFGESTEGKIVRFAIAHFVAIAAGTLVTFVLLQFELHVGTLLLPIALVVQSYVRTFHPLLFCPLVACACCLA
jgi:hypothetical protein